MSDAPIRGGMSAGVPMDLSMQIGMPIGNASMGMANVPMMPMMPMMSMNPMMAQQMQIAQHQLDQQVAEDPEQSSAKRQRQWLVKELETASEELANKVAAVENGIKSKDQRDAGSPPRTTSADGGASSSAQAKITPAEETEPPKCHLHPAKKPNAKCKFCQRIQQFHDQSREKATSSSSKATARESGSSRNEDLGGMYSRRSFNCSPMLKDQILGSSYFKSLLSITSIDELIEEIEKYADTMDVYNGNGTASPSCFICQVYRLFTLPDTEDVDEALVPFIDHTSTVVRCAGFVYMRYVVPPNALFDKFEEYLFDTMELTYVENGQTINTTIGLFVEGLLGKVKYFGTPLPRIPVKVHQKLERELAPMWQYRKRMEANHRSLERRRIADLPVEVCVDGEWLRGSAKEYSGKVSHKRKARVELEDGQIVSVHLGKIVLRDGSSRSDSEDSGSDGGKKKRRRRSPDWSRYKGRSEKEMTAEFRDKWKEEAVCTTGKSYSRRPFTMEEELWRREPEARVSMLGEDGRSSGSRRQQQEEDSVASEVAKKIKRDEELERQSRMRAIFEKYGSASSASKKSSSTGDMDVPDVLRLG